MKEHGRVLLLIKTIVWRGYVMVSKTESCQCLGPVKGLAGFIYMNVEKCGVVVSNRWGNTGSDESRNPATRYAQHVI